MLGVSSRCRHNFGSSIRGCYGIVRGYVCITLEGFPLSYGRSHPASYLPWDEHHMAGGLEVVLWEMRVAFVVVIQGKAAPGYQTGDAEFGDCFTKEDRSSS